MDIRPNERRLFHQRCLAECCKFRMSNLTRRQDFHIGAQKGFLLTQIKKLKKDFCVCAFSIFWMHKSIFFNFETFLDCSSLAIWLRLWCISLHISLFIYCHNSLFLWSLNGRGCHNSLVQQNPFWKKGLKKQRCTGDSQDSTFTFWRTVNWEI